MNGVLRFIEACLLMAMGSFMATLAVSSAYWQFLNPKYSWLTLSTGVILITISFACLFNTRRQRRVSELLGIVIFLGLAVTAIVKSDYLAMGTMPGAFSPPVESDVPEMPNPAGGSLSSPYREPSSESMVMVGEREFVKINVAELLNMELEGALEAGGGYAVQGAVLRTPELDKAGYIGIGRLLISCCFADSTGVVALFRVGDPTAYKVGTWVRAVGVLEEGTPFPGQTLTVTGALTAARSERFAMDAVAVAETPVEGVPFVFEIRDRIPFAY